MPNKPLESSVLCNSNIVKHIVKLISDAALYDGVLSCRRGFIHNKHQGLIIQIKHMYYVKVPRGMSLVKVYKFCWKVFWDFLDRLLLFSGVYFSMIH